MIHLIKKSNKSSGENLLIEKRIKKLEKSVEQLDIDVSKLKISLIENDKNGIIVDKKPTIEDSSNISKPVEHPLTKPEKEPVIPDVGIDDSEIDGLDNI